MTVIERLKLGRERIARGWTQGAYARDSEGGSVLYKDPRAVCWCASGALRGEDDASFRAGMALIGTIGRVPEWNDAPGRTQAEVLKAFDDTIARLEAAEANR